MNFDLAEKIALLNKLSGGTLCITHYTQWTIGSYGNNSLFKSQKGCNGFVYAPDFTECVNKAYRLAGEEMANE